MPEMEREKPPNKSLSTKPAKAAPQYQLYLMRHGKAIAGGPPYAHDAKRPLTAQGIKDLQKISRGLIRLGVEFDWIVSSPLIRAKETAQTVAEAFPAKLPVEFTESLSPAGAAEALLTFLAKHPDRTSTLLVGHEPGLSELAGRLIGASIDAGFVFKKGGCCLITFAAAPRIAGGRLLWWLTPRVLRKLA